MTIVTCLEDKERRLRDILSGMDSLIVAFSGGIDSSVLLKIAHQEVPGKLLAVMAVPEMVEEKDREEALELAEELGVSLRLLHTPQMERSCFTENSPQRCYHCKNNLIESLSKIAEEEGYMAIADGTNADDMLKDRPGLKALEEWGVRSPLAEAGLDKKDVRELARKEGLKRPDRPSTSCLATRIPYYEEITQEKLSQIRDSESFLRSLGLDELRVRYHGEVARIEVPASSFSDILENREQIVERLKQLGFTYVTLDLQGFRSGSMDEAPTADRE